ncbi:alpha/beta fold hydrolase [Paraliomyxa miuraensis]|uniref:alpha/beta fold hydrolase n=1 Tax=Paraliomyxa miuraensis TaxID=376150 RepID=UPI002255135F|nr:alpha/beta fold hydrolase [Paraliomyxa miuraensis]MCX4244957.1 alpha/beta fold hydrolase [Paraliomyxa miuraensis]
MVELAPTPRDVILRDGGARLLRFRRGTDPSSSLPLLLVPSLINKWYVLDLRPGSSVVQALVGAGIDTFCLDWGEPGDEDRYLEWDDVIARLDRMIRRVLRVTGAPRVGLLGYCMGATLTAIEVALRPERVAAFVNLAGPIDFSQGGFLAHMTDARWFHPEAIASAGNMQPTQMQAGFTMLRPTAAIAKWVTLLDRAHDPAAREAFEALETWASDNVAFPAAAYVRYIRDLYQRNELVLGQHHVGGKRVDLGRIQCPLLTVVAERDTICPPAAALALGDRSGSERADVLSIPGGHVGAVVGSRAARKLYPALTTWLRDTLCN